MRPRYFRDFSRSMRRGTRWLGEIARLLAKTVERFHRRRHRFGQFAAFVAVMAVVTAAPGQLGDASFVFTSNVDLDRPTPVGECVNSIDCLSKVGGIAFGAVAVPRRGDLQLVDLSYTPSAADGSRFQVTVDDAGARKLVVLSVPDWILVPLIAFAQGSQHAVFTLFGHLSNATQEQQLKSAGYEILNYHPSLKHTLLGWRLFHADVLLLSNAAMDLPRWRDGTYLLGTGELPPIVAQNKASLDEIVAQFAPTGSYPFQSYLITDYQQQVSFDSNGTHLTLDGWPLWYSWRLKQDTQAETQKIWDDSNAPANVQLQAEYDADAATMTPAELAAKYTDEYQQRRFDVLFDAIVSPQVLKPLPALSSSLSDAIKAHNGLNPAVYTALTQTMRIAAFLRYAKGQQSAALTRLATLVAGVQAGPSTTTPAAYKSAAEMIIGDGGAPGTGGVGSGGQQGAGGLRAGGNSGTTGSGGIAASGGSGYAGAGGSAATGGVFTGGRDGSVHPGAGGALGGNGGVLGVDGAGATGADQGSASHADTAPNQDGATGGPVGTDTNSSGTPDSETTAAGGVDVASKSGGCGCRTSPTNPTLGGFLTCSALLALLLKRSRRRRTR